MKKRGNGVTMRIILASASPRRREILEGLSVDFSVLTADTDESCSLTDPREYAMELAGRKGRAVFETLSEKERDETLVISADTVVYAEGRILGKPKDEDDAKDMLELISGRTHSVISGIAITSRDGTCVSYGETSVRVANIPKDQIDAYVDTKDPMDKAGAYGIQGEFSKWVEGIDGCYFNVVGLPTNKLNELFHSVTGRYL